MLQEKSYSKARKTQVFIRYADENEKARAEGKETPKKWLAKKEEYLEEEGIEKREEFFKRSDATCPQNHGSGYYRRTVGYWLEDISDGLIVAGVGLVSGGSGGQSRQ